MMWSADSGHALVVEDNQETRNWLVFCVQTAFPGLLIHTAEDMSSALSLLMYQDIDLALVDLGLPDGSGMEVIKALQARTLPCYVVVATIYDDDKNLFAALKAGARGYILKDQDRDRIVSYLQGIKKDQPPLSAASSQRLIKHFNTKGEALSSANLTPREIEVLCLIGKGYSVDDAASMLMLSADTVKGYVKSIYAKLDVSNRAEVTMEAIRLGIIDAD